MPDNRAYDMPAFYSPWEDITDLTEEEAAALEDSGEDDEQQAHRAALSADLSNEERTPKMPDRNTQEEIRGIADQLRENGDKLLAGEDGSVAYRPDGFSEREREMERTNQHLRREQQADPCPELSDDEVLRRLGRG